MGFLETPPVEQGTWVCPAGRRPTRARGLHEGRHRSSTPLADRQERGSPYITGRSNQLHNIYGRKIDENTKYLHTLSRELCLTSSKILTPTPLSDQRVCPPPAPKAGDTHSPGGETVGGSIFWKTPAIGLASYNNLSTDVNIELIMTEGAV